MKNTQDLKGRKGIIWEVKKYLSSPVDPYTIDLTGRLETKGQFYIRNTKNTIATAGIIWFIIVTLFWWGILKGDAHADSSQHLAFLSRFPEEHRVIGCYNDVTKEIRQSETCTQWGDHNIILPPRSHIEKWLEIYNEQEIVNRLALVNFESAFREEVWNKFAYWYVQTLRKWNISPKIESQLQWMKNREEVNKKEYAGTSRRCGFYWENHNYKDGYEAGEYWVLACLYRYHYHAHKGTWYAKRWVETTKFYKWYMFGYGQPTDYQ